MAESSWKADKKKEPSIESVNNDIKSLSLSEENSTEAFLSDSKKKNKRKERKRFVQSTTPSPSSDSWTPPSRCEGQLTKKSPTGAKSKIPLPLRLSASDTLCETHKQYHYLHSGSGGLTGRGLAKSSSSSSSQSSEATKLRLVKERFRRSSDSHIEKGFLLPYGLRVQHAAHRCAWSESDNTSTSQGSCSKINLSRFKHRDIGSNSTLSPSIMGSQGRGMNSASTSGSCQQHGAINRRPVSQQSKFEVYMPLCEVQQGLKKGEFLEGVLRINPRNYEDAYISAPDGQTDIYIGGMQLRNRALNGDIVVVKLRPPEEWKILWDSIREHEERIGCSFFQPPEEPENNCNLDENFESEEVSKDEPSGWDQNCGPRMPDTLEILGVAELQQQINEYCQTVKNNSKKKRTRRRKPKTADPQKLPNSEAGTSKEVPTTIPVCVPDVNNCLDVSSTDSAIKAEFDSGLTVVKERSDKINVQELDKQQASTDSWTTGTEKEEPRWIVSPEDLLNLDDFEIPNFSGVAQLTELDKTGLEEDENNSCNGEAVAPDQLSEEDYSSSLSVASDGSHYLAQALEDAAFFASQQDGFNNNSGEDNVQDAYTRVGIQPQEVAATVANANNAVPFSELPSNAVSVPVINSAAIDEGSQSEGTNLLNVEHSVNKSTDNDVEGAQDLAGDKLQGDTIRDIASVKEIGQFEDTTPKNEKSKKKRHRKHKKKKVKGMDQNDLHAQTEEPSFKVEKEIVTKTNKTQNSEKKMNDSLRSQPNTPNIYDIMKVPNWAKFVQRTGKVVSISEQINSRIAMGYIKLLQDKNPNWAMFAPKDHRLPRIFVPMGGCPKGFFERPADFSSTLFIARITEWEEDSNFARGCLVKSLGEAGDIEPETDGILLEHNVDFSDFSEDVLQDLPKAEPFKIPELEYAERRNFCNDCVFTIDPKTARDLDDAVSCRVLEENILEIGVHIADVSHFIKDASALDKEASRRATSVYLVQKVVPMLPRPLCENLCSLNPGEDRLTFSVVWKMTPEGQVLDEWFGKTVIRSCVKLSYEHVQDMIENPDKQFEPNELPEIHGNFPISQIVSIVHKLQKISSNLRLLRFNGGALRLDQVKIQFALNHETGLPLGYQLHELKESNRLIEELMLLANMAVAHKIYRTFPGKAFLRSHPPPQSKMLDDAVEMFSSMGIKLDGTSAGSLQASLSQYLGDDLLSQARSSVLTSLLSKPMKPATYFCAGCVEDPRAYHHYALNVPLYTHFTSPIRRYPDILVHRLLGAAIGIGTVPSQTEFELQKCALHCNQKKLNAKRVHEMSCELFLAAFVKECGPITEKAVVIAVMDHSFDVLILNMGVIKRIYCDKLPVSKLDYSKQMGVPQLSMIWKQPKGEMKQIISIFTMVDVVLSAIANDALKFQAIMKSPSNQQ